MLLLEVAVYFDVVFVVEGFGNVLLHVFLYGEMIGSFGRSIIVMVQMGFSWIIIVGIVVVEYVLCFVLGYLKVFCYWWIEGPLIHWWVGKRI